MVVNIGPYVLCDAVNSRVESNVFDELLSYLSDHVKHHTSSDFATCSTDETK